MFESVDALTDAQTPARVPSYKLTLWVFGSGELKTHIKKSFVCFALQIATI